MFPLAVAFPRLKPHKDINQYSLRKRALDELGFMGSREVPNALYGQPLAAWLADGCGESLIWPKICRVKIHHLSSIKVGEYQYEP